MTRVKICGITNMDDARAAVDAGADALGFILFERSPRYIPPDRARDIVASLPPFVTTVGVFVNEPAERVNDIARLCLFHAVQLHGSEPSSLCEQVERPVIKAIRVHDASWTTVAAAYRVPAFLLDTYAPDQFGGTGRTFDWNVVSGTPHRIILSGGLTPENVGDAVRRVRPYAVDTSSGVEQRPGMKDHGKVRAFVRAARQSDFGF
ncbi:MAG: phosphoribosylanthranilate isomerase [Candidatus Latescibacteria bacterium]|nr:phosphoribosylanthranilate isomerase [Candidatus Latescibacterota bacterium]